ncbi:CinA family protein [Nocardioides panaciterrulae]|uniref:PncC family amidohydrolase n=1 Tax=Nocardioides panaciterrulae TaxID=661492 RepID=A0A7Y9JAS3_9ACTN|nr:CinA family protein [Nocardioides panaciterrulae]NYD42175.1 PncC family amidohydrolase [Nocardioides panaciterrulae]
MTDLDTRVHLLLRAAAHTVATAESLTGGRLAVHFTTVPGSSETYLGGVVTYATEVKAAMLDVPGELIEEHGVVSAECAKAMATGVRVLTGASFGVSTTGVAGPTEQEGKEPGTVFVGISGPGILEAVDLHLEGGREEIQDQTCDRALEALAAILAAEETPLG